RAQIDADDLAGRPHPAGGEEAVQSRPAAQLQHGLAGANITEAERVADAAEGFGHGAGEGVDLLGVVAELLGAGRASGRPGRSAARRRHGCLWRFRSWNGPRRLSLSSGVILAGTRAWAGNGCGGGQGVRIARRGGSVK